MFVFVVSIHLPQGSHIGTYLHEPNPPKKQQTNQNKKKKQQKKPKTKKQHKQTKKQTKNKQTKKKKTLERSLFCSRAYFTPFTFRDLKIFILKKNGCFFS